MLNKQHPLAGLCYVLSEAFYHMYSKQYNLKPVRLKYYGITHWWLQTPNGRIIDFTTEQYTKPFPYHRGKGGGFLTKKPSKRAKEVIQLLSGE